MKVRTMIGIAVTFLFAWGPVAKAGDDLDELVSAVATKQVVGTDPNHVTTDEEVGRISETKEVLRLYLVLERVQNAQITLTESLSKPTVVMGEGLGKLNPFGTRGDPALVISPEGPFTIEQARQNRNAAETALNTDKEGPFGGKPNQDVIAQRKENLQRWNDIVAYVEKNLDGNVQDLANDESFSEALSQKNVDSFSKLEGAVGNSKELKAFDAATLKDFVAKAKKKANPKLEETHCPNGEIGLVGVCGPGGKK